MIVQKEESTVPKFRSDPIRSFSYDIDGAMKGHIFKMLRKGIYKDPILACVREYACNAIDSNVEAGKTAKEVTLYMPNQFEECFIIEDQGVGLDLEEVGRVFCMYGSSTKRNSNSGIGCLGIGSKAAFAYTDTFTIEAVKDGVERVFISSIEGGTDSEDSGGIDFVAEQLTDKDNGVRIKVPVRPHDHEAFERAIRHFMSFQNPENCPKVVGVDNIIHIACDVDEGDWGMNSHNKYSFPNVFISNMGVLAKTHIMMGPVPYSIDVDSMLEVTNDEGNQIMSDEVHEMLRQYPTLIKFEVGEINFGPSREEVAYDAITARKIQERGREIYEFMVRKVKDAYKDIKTPYRAILNHQKNKSFERFFLETDNLTLPNNISVDSVLRGVIALPSRIMQVPDRHSTDPKATREVREYTKDISVLKCSHDGNRWSKVQVQEISISEDRLSLIVGDCGLSGCNQRLNTYANECAYGISRASIYLIEVKDRRVYEQWLEETGLQEANISKLSTYDKTYTHNDMFKRKTRKSIFRYRFRDMGNYRPINSDNWDEVGDLGDLPNKIFVVSIYTFLPYYKNRKIRFSDFNGLLKMAIDDDSIDFSLEDAESIIGVKSKALQALQNERECVNVIDHLEKLIVDIYEDQSVSQILADAEYASHYSSHIPIFKTGSGYETFSELAEKELDETSLTRQFMAIIQHFINQGELAKEVSPVPLKSIIAITGTSTFLDSLPAPSFKFSDWDTQIKQVYPLLEYLDHSGYRYTYSYHSKEEISTFIDRVVQYIKAMDSISETS